MHETVCRSSATQPSPGFSLPDSQPLRPLSALSPNGVGLAPPQGSALSERVVGGYWLAESSQSNTFHAEQGRNMILHSSYCVVYLISGAPSFLHNPNRFQQPTLPVYCQGHAPYQDTCRYIFHYAVQYVSLANKHFWSSFNQNSRTARAELNRSVILSSRSAKRSLRLAWRSSRSSLNCSCSSAFLPTSWSSTSLSTSRLS